MLRARNRIKLSNLRWCLEDCFLPLHIWTSCWLLKVTVGGRLGHLGHRSGNTCLASCGGVELLRHGMLLLKRLLVWRLNLYLPVHGFRLVQFVVDFTALPQMLMLWDVLSQTTDLRLLRNDTWYIMLGLNLATHLFVLSDDVLVAAASSRYSRVFIRVFIVSWHPLNG